MNRRTLLSSIPTLSLPAFGWRSRSHEANLVDQICSLYQMKMEIAKTFNPKHQFIQDFRVVYVERTHNASIIQISNTLDFPIYRYDVFDECCRMADKIAEKTGLKRMDDYDDNYKALVRATRIGIEPDSVEFCPGKSKLRLIWTEKRQSMFSTYGSDKEALYFCHDFSRRYGLKIVG